MKDFILTWYREIIYCFIALVELVFAVVTICKKSKKEAPIKLDLLELVPKFILLAEKYLGAGKGEAKRDFVLEMLSSEFYQKTGCSIDESTFRYLAKAIEDILYTPQKKGVNND